MNSKGIKKLTPNENDDKRILKKTFKEYFKDILEYLNSQEFKL